MEPRLSSEDRLAALTQTWVGSVLIIGALLFVVLGFMDFFASQENFIRFMMYRFVIGGILVFLYFLNKLKQSKPYQYTLAAIGAVSCAVTVELAILMSGGQSSIYYAAMNILVICCLGFAPINMSLSFLLVVAVYAIYVVPIVLTEPIAGGVFVSNNAFLIATIVIGLLMRYHNQKLLFSELELRAELAEDKRKLELYSSLLKEQVDEKTGELAITEQKYRALFDYANDGIAVLDRNGTITDVNHRFCELHGFERETVIGTSFRLLEIETTKGEIDERLKKILDGESTVYVAEHYRKNGSRIFLEISSRSIDIGGLPHIQSFHRDITEKMKLQEQVLQSQKMESMGVLAGGIAHDFSNIVTAILGHTEVLRRHVKADEFGNRTIKTVEDAARRAGQLVSKLLSFARKERLELAPTELNRVVSDTAELLGRTLIDRNITIRMKLDPNLPAVKGDYVHLEQIIANLVMNSMDAMPAGGVITISTFSEDLTTDSHAYPFIVPGKYVVLEVNDTGTGIPREIVDRIFEPFFTTKPPGKGTGLGLAMVYGIVKSHKGEVRVSSRAGKGTTFSVYIPAPEHPVLITSGSSADAPFSVSKGERIFVVDDEKDVLSSIKDNLEQKGYKVFTAVSPVLALDLFETVSDEIDLVITDIVMPVMNGAELSLIMKRIKPRVKVIAMSGYDGGHILEDAGHIDYFLKKPFDGGSLITCIHKALNVR